MVDFLILVLVCSNSIITLLVLLRLSKRDNRIEDRINHAINLHVLMTHHAGRAYKKRKRK